MTHWHEDHAGNVPALAATGLPMADARGVRGAAARASGDPPRIGASCGGRTPTLSQALEPFDPAPLTVLAAPGHSPDHMVVWDPERRILVSGDLFLGVKVRVAHDHESPRTLVETLRQMAALEPQAAARRASRRVRDGAAQLRAKADWNEETIAAIEQLAAEGVGVGGDRAAAVRGGVAGGWLSGGEYSRSGFVRAVLREATGLILRAVERLTPRCAASRQVDDERGQSGGVPVSSALTLHRRSRVVGFCD